MFWFKLLKYRCTGVWQGLLQWQFVFEKRGHFFYLRWTFILNHAYVCVLGGCAWVHWWGQRHQIPLELNLQEVISCRYECWETNLGLLQEQYMILTDGTSLQPRELISAHFLIMLFAQAQPSAWHMKEFNDSWYKVFLILKMIEIIL